MTSTSKNNPPVICILGPTAVGKTDLSIQIAKVIGGEILSVDSRQFYQQLSIGTAKPSSDEMKAVPHHFIDFLRPDQEITAGRFEKMALDRLDEIINRGKTPIITGGSGLYLRILLEGMGETPEADVAIRERLEAQLAEEGLPPLVQQLQKIDPEYCKSADLNNAHRVLRALEVFEISDRPFSSFLNQPTAKRPYRWVKVVLERPREELYQRINHRVDLMIEQGLEQEVRDLLPFKDQQSLKTIGYREWFPYFSGEVDLSSTIDRIKQASRKYAKRQITWLKRENNTRTFHPEQADEIVNYVTQQMETT